MADLTSTLIRLSAASGLASLLGPSANSSLTMLCLHGFFFRGESRVEGRDRLKGHLEWIARRYTPLSLSDVCGASARDRWPQRPLVVTVDDAKLDLLDVVDVFAEFGVPVALFPCVGWSDQVSPIDEETLLARVAARIQWYEGNACSLDLGERHALTLDPARPEHALDQLLEAVERDADYPLGDLEERLCKLGGESGGGSEGSPRTICDWSELVDLSRRGVEMGCHSMTHVPMAPQSDRRLRFEVVASKSCLEHKLGACPVFAYPYGGVGTFSDRTTSCVRSAGYEGALLATPGRARFGQDPFMLPRLVLPEYAVPTAEFRARVSGGGIPLSRAKQFVQSLAGRRAQA